MMFLINVRVLAFTFGDFCAKTPTQQSNNLQKSRDGTETHIDAVILCLA